jgi:hypothetical protein
MPTLSFIDLVPGPQSRKSITPGAPVVQTAIAACPGASLPAVCISDVTAHACRSGHPGSPRPHEGEENGAHKVGRNPVAAPGFIAA